MSTKVEKASTVETRHLPTTVTANASATSTSSPKISIFAAKSGFVIPKNKLSGSLVPIFRGGKKSGGSDVVNEESTKQVQRKTKWGPDLSQDAAVRKGRALAYQTRVHQITKQLNSGILEIWENQDSPSAAQNLENESSVQIKSEKSELLELEKREAIGEILKLNPSYKAPSDYKPLLKEAKVHVPIKEYPGYNFIGLIFGTASDTQKRLEKETGARIRVYGTKADTGEKAEITPSDGNEAHGAYEELYVQISADTFDKVDAAVSLIELLVTPVSVNPSAVSTTSTSVSGDNVNVVDQSQGTSTPYMVHPVGVNQELAQSVVGSAQTPQGQFLPYPGPWFPSGSSQAPLHPPSGFILPPNPSAAILSTPIQVSSSPFNPPHMPSLFGPRPVLLAGLGSVPQNPSLVPSRPQVPLLQRPFMPQAPFGHTGTPRNPSMSALRALPAQPSISTPPPFTGNQPSMTGSPPVVRPLGPPLSHPVSRPLSGPLPDRPLTPAVNSTQWLPSSAPGSMVQMAPPVFPPQGPYPATSQPTVASGAPLPNTSTVNMVSPVTFPPRPSAPESSSAAGNHSIAGLAFTSGPQPQAGLPPPSSLVLNQVSAPLSAHRPIQSSSPIVLMRPVMARAPPLVSTSTAQPPPPPPSQVGIPSPLSAAAPTFTPMVPPPTAPKPHPNSSDFTFQPHQLNNLGSQSVPRPGIQPPLTNTRPPNLTSQAPPPAPQTPSFHPAVQTSSLQPVMQRFQRPQLINNQMNQIHGQMASPFTGNPTVTSAPIKHLTFPNPNNPVASSSPLPQMGPRNLNPSPHAAVHMGGPFPPRPGNPLQLQQNYRPPDLFPPNQQQLGRVLPSPLGAQQVYDPFSPTSASVLPPQGGNLAKMKKQESDPEYEDLMASVGVK